MSELLIELFSEEIPARMQAKAAKDLEKLVQEQLFAAGYMAEGAKAFATPRRLTLVVTGLPAAQADRKEEKKGPRVGAPEQAVAGFLKSAGLSSLDQCEIREVKGAEVYFAVMEQKGRATADVVAGFMPELIRKFPWAKSMRWGRGDLEQGDLRWVRPLHHILCCYDAEIVPFEIGGIKSGDVTYGHRFMAPEEIQTRSFEDYEAKLRRAKVILDADERKERILEEARGLCAAQGLELIEDPGLLMEVAGLAEWPVVMVGSFDEKFLAVPDEALIASMKGHQKYFSVRDPKTGKLANKFVCVANMEAPDGGAAMRTGYERVLTARLSDAFYQYKTDLKTPLIGHAEKLKNIIFFEGLGTVADKVERVAALAREIAPVVGADPEMAETAARLAKADLVTEMVGEYASLQGVMGRYYALEEGIDPAIADAIRDHYKPVGQNDTVPTAPVSVAVALAEKIDTLTGFWAIDEKPTGSKDPFALRRAALGVIQIVLGNEARLELAKLLSEKIKLISQQLFDELREGNGAIVLFQLNNEQRANADEHVNGLDQGVAYWQDKSLTSRCCLVPLGWDIWHKPEARLVEYDKPVQAELCTAIGFIEDGFHQDYWNSDAASNDLLSFFHERLKVYLRDKGHQHDHIDAVLKKPALVVPDAAGDPGSEAEGKVSDPGSSVRDDNFVLEDDFVLIVKKLTALEAFLKTDEGANLLAAYKRATNILKAEEKKEALAENSAIDESLLTEAAEKALFSQLKTTISETEKALSSEDFESALAALSELRAPLDAFFEDVTVNDKNAATRQNRLAILVQIRQICGRVAQLSEIKG